MANMVVSTPGLLDGKTDTLEGFLKVFAGETITAFTLNALTLNRHVIRTIQSGKSASFPVMGRGSAFRLKRGERLSDKRKNIKHNEIIIPIDGVLASECLITDLDEAMSHYDFRNEYSKQQGEQLAFEWDKAILTEAVKMAVNGTENIAGETGKSYILTEQMAVADFGTNEATGKKIVAMLYDARAKLSRNRVPLGDRYCYINPEGYSALVQSLVAIAKEYDGAGSISKGNILMIAGFEIIECPHLTDGGLGATGAEQGDGHAWPQAKLPAEDVQFILMHRSAVGTVKLLDMRMEHDRVTDVLGDQIVTNMVVGHGGLRPEAVIVGCIELV